MRLRWLEGSFEGSVQHEPGIVDAQRVVRALERAGFVQVPEPTGRAAAGSYRQAASTAISLTFVPNPLRSRRPGKYAPVLRGYAPLLQVHVWAHDASTLAYRGWVPPWAMVALTVFAGGCAAAGIASFVQTDALSPLIGGALGAVASVAMPNIWLDDARAQVHEALESIAVDFGAALDEASPASVPAAAPSTPRLEPVRIAPESPALAAAVKTSRDAYVRRIDDDPEATVEALEREARRGGS